MLTIFEYNDLSKDIQEKICQRHENVLKCMAFEQLIFDVVRVLSYTRKEIAIDSVAHIFELTHSGMGGVVHDILVENYKFFVTLEELRSECRVIVNEWVKLKFNIDYTNVAESYFGGKYYKQDGTEVLIIDTDMV